MCMIGPAVGWTEGGNNNITEYFYTYTQQQQQRENIKIFPKFCTKQKEACMWEHIFSLLFFLCLATNNTYVHLQDTSYMLCARGWRTRRLFARLFVGGWWWSLFWMILWYSKYELIMCNTSKVSWYYLFFVALCFPSHSSITHLVLLYLTDITVYPTKCFSYFVRTIYILRIYFVWHHSSLPSSFFFCRWTRCGVFLTRYFCTSYFVVTYYVLVINNTRSLLLVDCWLIFCVLYIIYRTSYIVPGKYFVLFTSYIILRGNSEWVPVVLLSRTSV